MDYGELIKQGSGVVGAGVAAAGALRLTEIVKAMLGPATAEVAERFRDQVRLYRFGRQLECLKKAERMVAEAGFIPNAIPIKLLFPLLEGASLEENDTLHSMWASLLANAASPDNGLTVRPGFIADLKEMAPDEGALLNWMYQEFEFGHGDLRFASSWVEDNMLAAAFYDPLGFGPKGDLAGPEEALRAIREYLTCLNGLQARGLIDRWLNDEGTFYSLTVRGRAFVQACQPPGRRTNDSTIRFTK